MTLATWLNHVWLCQCQLVCARKQMASSEADVFSHLVSRGLGTVNWVLHYSVTRIVSAGYQLARMLDMTPSAWPTCECTIQRHLQEGLLDCRQSCNTKECTQMNSLSGLIQILDLTIQKFAQGCRKFNFNFFPRIFYQCIGSPNFKCGLVPYSSEQL